MDCVICNVKMCGNIIPLHGLIELIAHTEEPESYQTSQSELGFIILANQNWEFPPFHDIGTSSQPCLETGYTEDKYTKAVSMNFESEQRTMWINRRNLLHIN